MQSSARVTQSPVSPAVLAGAGGERLAGRPSQVAGGAQSHFPFLGLVALARVALPADTPHSVGGEIRVSRVPVCVKADLLALQVNVEGRPWQLIVAAKEFPDLAELLASAADFGGAA